MRCNNNTNNKMGCNFKMLPYKNANLCIAFTWSCLKVIYSFNRLTVIVLRLIITSLSQMPNLSLKMLSLQDDGSLSAAGVAVKWAGAFLREGTFVSSTSTQSVRSFALLLPSGRLRIILINKTAGGIVQVMTSPRGSLQLPHVAPFSLPTWLP